MARLQLYYDERAVEGTVSSDSGAEIRDGLDCAAKRGVAHENLWPYAVAKFKQKPGKAVYADALKFQVLERQVVQVDADHLKAALASGYPVVVGFTCYKGIDSDETAKTGMLPMPGKKDRPVGGHCVYAVGYGIKPGTFTCRNSWSSQWGDGGDFHMPEAYLCSPTYASDFWGDHQGGGGLGFGEGMTTVAETAPSRPARRHPARRRHACSRRRHDVGKPAELSPPPSGSPP